MPISDAVAANILAKCARHCCICRRFKPLHLHVHHIRERSEGGTDEEDNLIATCMTCHSDIHTQTKLTRRFTERELKLHRDAVYQLVRDGKLPAGPELPDAMSLAVQSAVERADSIGTRAELMPEAVELLVAAASAPAGDDNEATPLVMARDIPLIQAGTKRFGGDARCLARYRKAFQTLIDRGYLEHISGIIYRLTSDGWVLADELLAAGSTAAEDSSRE
jgi:hypothetical protein